MKSIFATFAAWALFGASLIDGTRVIAVNGGGYFPVLIRLHDGKLMAVLRGGAPHIGVKGRLDVITSTDDGKTWSAPRTAIDGPEDDRNPAFGQLSNGDLLLGYAVIHGYDDTGLKLLANSRNERKVDGVYLMRSSDGGKTWSKPQIIEATHALQKSGATISPFGKIVQLSDGTILMSVYYEFFDDRGNQDFVFRSHDGGRSWGEPVLVGQHVNETALLVLPDGRILAAMRSEKGAHLSVASSKDQGRTWTAPVQVTGDNEHPADMIGLKNGDILLTYGERNAPFGVEAILSHDGGKSWDSSTKVKLANDASNRDCGYPSSVQLPNGKIVTLYYQVDDAQDTPGSAKAKSIVWSAPVR
jgi:Neuraminidase (sialidase)